MVLKNEFKANINFNICNEAVNMIDTVKLLRIEIDKNLTFDFHIAKLCTT